MTSQSNVSPHSALSPLSAPGTQFRLRRALIGRQRPAITICAPIGPAELWMGLTLSVMLFRFLTPLLLGLSGQGTLSPAAASPNSVQRERYFNWNPAIANKPGLSACQYRKWQQIIWSRVLQRKTLFRVSQKTKDSHFSTFCFPNNPRAFVDAKPKIWAINKSF